MNRRIVPPVVNGEVLITIHQFAQHAGLSVDRIRERCSETRLNRRGGFIPSYKYNGMRWFGKTSFEALQVARNKSNKTSQVSPANNEPVIDPLQKLGEPDMSWL